MRKQLQLWVPVLVAAVALHAVACKRPFETAIRTTGAVRSAGQLATDTLASVARDRHATCTAKAAGDKAAYRACIDPIYKALAAWRRYGVPAIDSAVAAAVGAIRLAREAKAKSVDVMAYLRPAICMMVRAVRDWGHLLPRGALDQLEQYLKLAEGVTCG